VCGIAGIFCKQSSLEPQLGQYLTAMLHTLQDGGADSCGLAWYAAPSAPDVARFTLYHDGAYPWDALLERLSALFGDDTRMEVRAQHAVLWVSEVAEVVCQWLAENEPRLTVQSIGKRLSIFKDCIQPEPFIQQFQLSSLQGSHALVQVHLASETPTVLAHCPPQSSGMDYCLLQQGHIANVQQLRRYWQQKGTACAPSEHMILAHLLQAKLTDSADIEAVLMQISAELDGFYSLVLGSEDGFAVLSDPLAGHSLLIAETEHWIAIASHLAAFTVLPNYEQAQIRPAPAGKVFRWQSLN